MNPGLAHLAYIRAVRHGARHGHAGRHVVAVVADREAERTLLSARDLRDDLPAQDQVDTRSGSSSQGRLPGYGEAGVSDAEQDAPTTADIIEELAQGSASPGSDHYLVIP